MRKYLKTRGSYVVRCWKHAKRHWAGALISVFSVVYSALLRWSTLVDVGKWADTSKWPKLPLSWAFVILSLGLLFIVVDGGYRLALPEKSEPEGEPNLIFQVPTIGGLSYTAGVWQKGVSSDGSALTFVGINIPIKNEAPHARLVSDADKVKAQIIFTSKGVVLRESSPASWIGESSKTIAIPVAETKELLVAFRGIDSLGYWQVEWDGLQLAYSRGEVEVRLLKEKTSGWEIIDKQFYTWWRTSEYPGLLIESVNPAA